MKYDVDSKSYHVMTRVRRVDVKLGGRAQQPPDVCCLGTLALLHRRYTVCDFDVCLLLPIRLHIENQYRRIDLNHVLHR